MNKERKCDTNTHTTHTHTHEYYSAIIKKKILPFVTTWRELEGIVLSEISQTEKDKYCMIPLMVWNLKKKKNLCQTHSNRA